MVDGIGFLGAGPGVAALHLPTVARLAGRFRVTHIADAGSGRAADLAARIGARSSTGTADLLADPAVDVVAIASPPAEHAAQLLAAVEAGARAIFCEKPIAFTADDAEAVVAACRAAGTVLVVGTNHLFDPAWGRAKHHLDASGGPVQSVAITLALPPNGRYHELVTEFGDAAPVPRSAPPGEVPPAVAASIVRQLVLGLAIHDLPTLRDLVPSLEVVSARFVAPIGYAIGAIGAGGVAVSLAATMLPEGADALWRMSIVTSVDRLDVEFPPAFVHAGSARARVWAPDGRVTDYGPLPEDGYVAEWRALAALLDGGRPVEYDAILDDALFAIRLADAAHDAVLAGGAA